MSEQRQQIWTIGHSTLPIERFLALLSPYRIELLTDVRRYPGSRRHPHFAREALHGALDAAGIRYAWLPDLGGRRTPRKHSHNTAWRNASFRGYADYMEGERFAQAMAQLLELASERRTAIMCAEHAWQQCHRGLISDWLKAHGWEVLHILSNGSMQEHPYTEPARVMNGQLHYAASDASQAALGL
jgi:uncharacterized protein (DUF488 family)